MTNYRLPEVNGDDGSWGTLLNQYLNKEHYNNDNGGVGDPASGGHQHITLRPGTATAGTAPIMFDNSASSVLLGTKVAGAFEYSYTNDRFYLTQVTDTARKAIATYYDDGSGATGDMYYRDSSGNFIRMPVGTTGKMLVSDGTTPAWTTVLSGTAKITVGTSAPGSPATGDLWIDTN